MAVHRSSDPDTVAEHSFRAAIVGIALATLEGADPSGTAVLCLLHGSPESRIGDIEAVGRAYVSTASPEAVNTHQTAAMPDALADVFQELVRAYEAEDSIESHLAHDADKIETLLQAPEYEAFSHHDTAEWQESATAALRTDAAKAARRGHRRNDSEDLVGSVRQVLQRVAQGFSRDAEAF